MLIIDSPDILEVKNNFRLICCNNWFFNICKKIFFAFKKDGCRYNQIRNFLNKKIIMAIYLDLHLVWPRIF